jgi:hypothetical protein
LNLEVRKVAVILCSSRSGSSLLKDLLATHPDVASLDGEIEPFLALSKNGFGFNSSSDAITRLENSKALLDNLMDDLTVPATQVFSADMLKRKWEKRCLLQFPSLFLQRDRRDSVMQSVEEALADMKEKGTQQENVLQSSILTRIFRRDPWRIHFYDGRNGMGERRCFDETLKIEEPPFVSPRPYRRAFEPEDAREKILLFKSPADAYRAGIYEQIFPNAEILYIHLIRGYAQTVNGLMDGWLSPIGFFSHNLRAAGLELDIAGYSDQVPFGKHWWKFDLPPNWHEFLHARLEDVCLNQWLSAHLSILGAYPGALKLAFEDFLTAPEEVLQRVTRYLGLSKLPPQGSLPVLMATEMPARQRWRKRGAILLGMGERQEVKATMHRLGYSMRPETWL